LHEASLVQGLLNIALKALNDYRGNAPGKADCKIKDIICDAGLLACFEADTLRACFEIFAEGTPAEGADLVINTSPLDCQCKACGKRFLLRERRFVCPACKSDQISFSGGNGLVLQAIKIDVGDDPDG